MKLNLQFFGGRGASSGSSANSVGKTPVLGKITAQQLSSDYSDGSIDVGDYDGGGNPNLIAWQQMDDADVGHYLHEISANTSLDQQPNDNWAYHDNPYQKFVVANGLNNPPTVLSDADFDNYLKSTGQTAFYRGTSGASAIDRFKNSPNNHVGNGIYGDGHYCTLPGDIATARNYKGSGNSIMRMALSPNARVVDLSTVQNNISSMSGKAQRALKKAGSEGPRTFGSNMGEAQAALKMGYNVIRTGWSYVVLTRDAVVVSDKSIR